VTPDLDPVLCSNEETDEANEVDSFDDVEELLKSN
jgi:hypothetical protein